MVRQAILHSSGGSHPIVAVDGRGGSGKSTFAQLLADGWPGAQVVEIDDFYLPSANRPEKPGPGDNFDRTRLREQVMAPFKRGVAGRYQRYDWGVDALAEWHEVPPTGILIVEGVYSTSEPLRDLSTYRVWVDSPYEVRLARGIARDSEAMRDTWVNSWMPVEDQYVDSERPARHAHLCLLGDGEIEGGEPVFYVTEATNE